MKKNTICKLTGLTQEEAAMWLCVGQSQWSMFESGKRSLSASSNLRISDLMHHMKTNSKPEKAIQDFMSEESKAAHSKLHKQLQQVTIEIILLQKKIIKFEEKRDKCLTALNAASFIEKNVHAKTPKDLHKVIQNRCLQTLKRYPLHQLLLMKHKADTLIDSKNKLMNILTLEHTEEPK